MSEEIDVLLESMSRLQHKLQLKLYNENKETQTSQFLIHSSIFSILPQNLIIQVFLFLDFSEDYPPVLETCKLFNFLMNSSTFQFLSYKVSVKHQEKKAFQSVPNAEEQKTIYNFDAIETKAQALLEMKKLQAVSKFIDNKITNQGKIIEELEKNIVKNQTDLRIQNSITKKCIEKIGKIEKSYEGIKAEADKNQSELVKIEGTDKLELEELKVVEKKLFEENKQLLNDTRVLSKEVNKVTGKNNQVVYRLEQYQEALVKIKDFFIAMFEPKMQNLIASFG